MSARVEPQTDVQAAAADLATNVAPAFAPPIAAVDPDDGWGNGPSLPTDHPAWMRDSLSVSSRARALFARIVPVVVRVIAFWEHRVRSITVAGGTLSVDASGSYRLP